MGSSHSHDGPHGHSHERGHSHEHGHSHSATIDHSHLMLSAPVSGGWINAKLTAHLSAADGNELDIFLEDQKGVPFAVTLKSFTAKVENVSTGENTSIQFTSAPADERPTGEPADRCSHFVAKAPWLDPAVLYNAKVNAFTLQGDKVEVEWRNFLPSTYAHHHD